MDVLGMILLLSSPFLLGMIYYGLVWLDTRFTEEKQQQKTDGTLPDWAGQIATVYENPLDHESDDQMTEGYECPHCGAPNQTKVVCEYCRSRNERALEKKSNTQSGDSGSSNIMSLNW